MGILESIVAVALLPRVIGGIGVEQFIAGLIIGIGIGILVDRYVLRWIADKAVRWADDFCGNDS